MPIGYDVNAAPPEALSTKPLKAEPDMVTDTVAPGAAEDGAEMDTVGE
eukprot:SAG25_NODE_1806_length_2310_cov_1.842153_2_plen_48_part_00